MADQLHPGDWIAGPFWEGPVRVVVYATRAGYDQVTVALADGTTRTYALTPDDLAHVTRVTPADRRALTFTGDPARFRLAVQAQRLRLAHALDPYAALNASRIDPLPHQFEAVYEHLLARPVVRALLAHDAGAGKTVMAGMVIKELQRRQGAHRVLIVAPAGLTVQWRRELLTKFALDFPIVDRDFIRERRSDDLLVWRETDWAITSVDFARQIGLRQALESVEWDLVIVDEAHKMAAYRRPNDTIRKTQAYELGETLTRHTTHFLLMTATPHKGDPENYRLLVRLIDPQWGDAAAYAERANPLVLRRTKEEMCKADGSPLYPERLVEPQHYKISREEGALFEAVSAYAKQRYAKAQTASQSAKFALLTLERRLASSPYALRESLARMRAQVQARLEGAQQILTSDHDGEDWAEWEDLTERDRWERETRAEVAAAALVTRRQARTELRQLDDFITRADALIAQEKQAKLVALKQACDVWAGKQGEQLIIFTEFKDTLDYLVGCLEAWGYTTTQIHGGMAQPERRKAERVFWDNAAQILVATEAAGEGINLQCCSVMINYDIPWNPCRLEQRMGRIHRYGQKAAEVHIFNLIAKNTLEGEVQDALLTKLEAMRKDLGDKVFNVVGEALWGDDLRRALERIALGERAGVDEAKRLIEQAEADARRAQADESRATITTMPLDVADFRRKQATFAAHRLSPEEAEKFFCQAVPFVGGTLEPFEVVKDVQSYPAFEVTLSPDFPTAGANLRHSAGAGLRPRPLRVSFWPAACSDDDAPDGAHKAAVLFIAPGHWLFEALLERVIAECAPDVAAGAVFLDVQPASASPYLVWFVRATIRDGLDRRTGDLLAAMQHRADQEQAAALPTEILDAFEPRMGHEYTNEAGEDVALRQGQAMLGAQQEIVDACVMNQFLPALTGQRAQQQAAFTRDRQFLTTGLDALASALNDQALDAYGEGDADAGERLADQAAAAQERKHTMLKALDLARQSLLTAPEVLGVALVLPAPLEVVIAPEVVDEESGITTVPMHRDPVVEAAAMQAALAYETRENRHPRDVHQGNSWDIESYDAQGNLLRYIEVKGRGPEDADVVTLTEPEWEAARRLGDRHWLYIVRLGDGQMWTIQNSYTKLQPKELKHWMVKIEDAAIQAADVWHVDDK
ncbi:MAG: DUF3883 domain-containing protein [Anaerolineae bacterium]|nr:DUF3883 domain-containing protein [Anaerolineae bacterium]